MRNTPLRAFTKKSPVRRSEAADTVVKQTAKKVIKTGVTRAVGSAAGAVAGGLGAAAGLGGAAYGLAKGYNKMGKTKTGARIIKDARMMPGKM